MGCHTAPTGTKSNWYNGRGARFSRCLEIFPPFRERIYLLFPSTYFLFKNRLFSDFKITEQTTIGTVLISDHAPEGVALHSGQLPMCQFTRWRFNSSLLRDEHSVEFIQSELLDYWLNNEGSVSNPAVEWDAFKAVIRGRLIQHCSNLKKR